MELYYCINGIHARLNSHEIRITYR